MIDPQFAHAIADRFGVTGEACLQPHDTLGDPLGGAGIAQTI